jgi:hypothetical protein
MQSDAEPQQGHLVLTRGGLYAAPEWKARRGVKRIRLRVPTTLERRLDSRMHFAALKVRGAQGEVPSRPWQAIRETTGRPWRFLARRLVEAHQAGAPVEQVTAMAVALKDWIEIELYGVRQDDHGPKRAA